MGATGRKAMERTLPGRQSIGSSRPHRYWTVALSLSRVPDDRSVW